jgi:hypothetical protein
MSSTITRSGRTFEGMAYPDAHPLTVPDRFVTRVHMFDVPATLREHAHNALGDLSGNVWWTVGEFRYAGEGCYETAVACRNRRGQVEYGIESE